METTTRYYENRDQVFYWGLGLIACCLSLYVFLLQSHSTNSTIETSIFINYGAVLFYLTMLCGSNYNRSKNILRQTNRYHYICLLTLATISCLTLNISINIFDQFSTWVMVYMSLMYGGLIGFCFLDKLPNQLRIPLFFVLGMGTALSTYFTLFLLPLMPFGLVLCFVLGLSLHLVVPLFVLLNSITLFVRTEKTKMEKTAYGIGLASPCLFALLFVLQWAQTNQLIEATYHQTKSTQKYHLPAWIRLSQQLSDGFFTERILKGGIVYTSFHNSSWGGWEAMTLNSFRDKKEHDPLVAIASIFSGELPISHTDRVRILKFYNNNRHDAHRKLWSGKNLSTTKIETKTQIYPEYRLAYTEKTFIIKNNSRQSWRSEEALYSFQLPEGSVATSLSLWVNGIEQPSRLTTRGKADSAYVEIVGVEKRDPALLHWQEGNRLTVTVFPCPTTEDRIFKIGITSPMVVKDNQLVLPPLEIEGPPAFFAEKVQQITFPSRPNFTYTEDYLGNISCPKVPLSDQHFNFQNRTFWVEPYEADTKYFDPSVIYLDVNKSWTPTEFEQVCRIFSDKDIYLYHQDSLHLVQPNAMDLFHQANQTNFSLFPLDLIQDRSKALLVSKSTAKSPNLNDLKNTAFGKLMIKDLVKQQTPLPLYNLSASLSPYLQSLKEFYVFNYDQGSLEQLKNRVKQQQFIAMHPSTNASVLHQSDMVLYSQVQKQPIESTAPDHLMRLFAYHQILKKIGRGYFSSGYENEELVAIAQQAHIVSPISSMIVLETKKDYERFGIEENEEGLGNVSTPKQGLNNAVQQHSGAVPEPHEWLFMGLIALGLLVLQLKKMKL
ncbi:XrtN system VIT domain-containing protein [Aureispira anguillae]|uniref:XrtN system VIT domain-containing protein n=1 Tax=Aureispira anguillae TaxID=2864201 RepID=A0A915YE75_9BACT|nr:XrtN system VIT domain-containing protein [Aureispira anguillae]BDS11422.1 XrtN system VIT domain-containing protein [Aureispira anguillae]